MRKLRAQALALSMALALSGCGVGSSLSTNPIPAPIRESVNEGTTKALYVAEAAFKGVTSALEIGVDSGQLKGANAAKALAIYDKLNVALNKARTTKQKLDIVTATDLIAEIWTILPLQR